MLTKLLLTLLIICLAAIYIKRKSALKRQQQADKQLAAFIARAKSSGDSWAAGRDLSNDPFGRSSPRRGGLAGWTTVIALLIVTVAVSAWYWQ